MRPKFSDEQRSELLSLGIYPEQVRRLEILALPSISWRLVRPARMGEVRDKLAALVGSLAEVERLYVRISSMPGAGSEALWRLYQAQEDLGFTSLDQIDALHDSLQTATLIVTRALEDLPQQQRTRRRDSAEFVRLILKALQLGHAEHFDCAGFGDEPSKEPMPPFLIDVARKKKPFPQVAAIVSEASGGWSADDAIEAYLKREG
jgi:hypothetical protein